MREHGPLPGWVGGWCRTHLGSGVDRVLLDARPASDAFGLRLDDGREVLVKSRARNAVRDSACVQVQRYAASAGVPCAAPLTDAVGWAGRSVHAEEWRPGGLVRHDAGPQHAADAARALATVLAVTSGVDVPTTSLTPNPVWVQVEHDGPRAWPPFAWLEDRQAASGIVLLEWLDEVQERVRARIARSSLPHVVGHADWEAQNLRWDGRTLHTVHDWDSLAALPEAAVVGAAAGSFASTDVPTLAPLVSSEVFLEAYQHAARRRLSPDEVEVAWAASLHPAAHNARGEIVVGSPLVAAAALREQAPERLRRAGA